MKRARWPVWTAAGWTLFIPLLSLLPPSLFPSAGGVGIPHFDKLVHALLYGVQTLLLIAAGLSRPWRRGRFSLAAGSALAASLYGFLMEVLQRLLTECRVFSWGDVLANLLGAAAAALAAYPFLRRVPRPPAPAGV